MYLTINKENQVLSDAVKVFEPTSEYKPFPGDNKAKTRDSRLIPIGLLSSPLVGHEVLISIPNANDLLMGDSEFLSYTHSDNGWTLDQDISTPLEAENIEKLNESARNFKTLGRTSRIKRRVEDSEPFFIAFGQPPTGCNWDAELHPDDSVFEPLWDAYEYEDEKLWHSREIKLIDEDEDYIYLGTLPLWDYLDADGDLIYFYSKKLKRVILFPEFS